MQFSLSFAHANHLIKQIQLNDKLTAYELVCLCARVCLCVRVYRWQHFFAAVLTVLSSIEEEEEKNLVSTKPSFITESTFIPSYVLCVKTSKQHLFTRSVQTILSHFASFILDLQRKFPLV